MHLSRRITHSSWDLVPFPNFKDAFYTKGSFVQMVLGILFIPRRNPFFLCYFHPASLALSNFYASFIIVFLKIQMNLPTDNFSKLFSGAEFWHIKSTSGLFPLAELSSNSVLTIDKPYSDHFNFSFQSPKAWASKHQNVLRCSCRASPHIDYPSLKTWRFARAKNLEW